MVHRSVFHRDCTAIFPDCQFGCGRCLEEIRSVFAHLPGVAGVDMRGQGAQTRVIAVHDPHQVAVAQLMDLFRRLPSFYGASFAPTLLG